MTIIDLIEFVKLSLKNTKAFCLLGECYKIKKMKEEARKAYEDALKVELKLATTKKAC